MVLTASMVLTSTHIIILVLLNHTRTRGLSVACMRDFVFTILQCEGIAYIWLEYTVVHIPGNEGWCSEIWLWQGVVVHLIFGSKNTHYPAVNSQVPRPCLPPWPVELRVGSVLGGSCWWEERVLVVAPHLAVTTALHCIVLSCIELHYTALHCTALNCTALHYTALH